MLGLAATGSGPGHRQIYPCFRCGGAIALLTVRRPGHVAYRMWTPARRPVTMRG